MVLSCLVWVVISQYFFCPQFIFADPKPFSGNNIYNPYASFDSNKWVKCNFHAHSNAWSGITNGHGSSKDIHQAYDSLGYGIFSVSDYQKINKAGIENTNYISAYEHGFGLEKTHQLVLGDSAVCWTEFLLPQTLSNKQYILNRLSVNKSNVITLNHPAMRNGYTPEDLKYLSGYHCIEVLNPCVVSLAHWDTALSNGKPVFITGNDDLHNVFKEKRLGSMCTWVNVSIANKGSVLEALKKGKSYGMITGQAKKLPVLKKLTLVNDTLNVEVDKKAARIIISGQNGKILNTFDDTHSMKYGIRSSDSYVRVRLDFDSGTSVFLNPLFRQNSKTFINSTPKQNKVKSIVLRVAGCFILFLWLFFLYIKLIKNPAAKRNIKAI